MTGPHHLDWCGDRDCGDPSHQNTSVAAENERLRNALLAIHAMSATAPDESDRGFAALLGIESIARHALSTTGAGVDNEQPPTLVERGLAHPAAEIGCENIMWRGAITGAVVTCGVCDWCDTHFGPVRGSAETCPTCGFDFRAAGLGRCTVCAGAKRRSGEAP